MTHVNGVNVKGKICHWIADFLRNRTQQVSVNGCLSSCFNVTSGVPQGSVLGPILFVIYVNELPKLVNSTMKMYADDAKLYWTITNEADCKMLQDDLEVLIDWSKHWLLEFNVAKCRVMHCGMHNPGAVYYMKLKDGSIHELEATNNEKDLGVYIDSSLKPSFNCSKAANKAMSALKLLRLTFCRLTKTNFKFLYNMYIRPHLEHCVQAMGPYLQKDIKALERVQRRATKLVKGLKNKPYEQRLAELKMIPVEERLQRGNLIETFKILSGHTRINPRQFFTRRDEASTRGHLCKLKKLRAKTYARTKFFSHRVINAWNRLPSEVVIASSTNSFKNRLDKLMDKMTLSCLFDPSK